MISAVSRLRALKLEIRWLLAGAGGRILLLENAYGLPVGRATLDLDFGVMVKSWIEFKKLKDLICSDGRFIEDAHQSQRLRYDSKGTIDLVPFGPIAKPDNKILWPPEEEVEFNVLGFEEASDTAISLLINESLEVPVATPQAMLLLKFIAWQERHNIHPGRDVEDIAYILTNGAKIVGEEKLFEVYFWAMERAEYDTELASAMVLGSLVKEVATARSKEYLSAILERELDHGEDSKLVFEISGDHPAFDESKISKALELLQNFHEGFNRKA